MDKYPELRKAKEALEAEKASLLSQSGPLREEREKLREKMQPLEAELVSLNKRIKEIEGERLVELDNQIGALARAMGGRSMSRPA